MIRNYHLEINFPALDALVAYLRDKDNQQAQIDQLTDQVAKLTGGLAESGTGLQGTLDSQK